jgi:hypothetical protein
MFLQPRHLAVLALLPALGLILTCGGGGNNPSPRPAESGGEPKRGALNQGPPAKVTFSAANNGPGEGFEGVTLGLEGVAIRQGDHAWVDLPLAPGVHRLELLKSAAEAGVTLAHAAAVAPGVYDQVRLTLAKGPVHSVQLLNGSHVRDLAVPDTLTVTGLHLPVAPGGVLDAVLAFPIAHAIRETAPGSASFRLQGTATGLLVDRGAAKGAIAGKVTWASGGAPVGGVTVTAQALVEGEPTLVRTVTTHADGSYALDLLPPGVHHVVILPSLGVFAHDLALATPALRDGKGHCDLTLQPLRMRPAAIHAPALPAAGHDPVSLLRKMDKVGGKTGAWVVVGTAQEHGPVSFEALAPGKYRLVRSGGFGTDSARSGLFEKGLKLGADEKVDLPAWPAAPKVKAAPAKPKPSDARLTQK